MQANQAALSISQSLALLEQLLRRLSAC